MGGYLYFRVFGTYIVVAVFFGVKRQNEKKNVCFFSNSQLRYILLSPYEYTCTHTIGVLFYQPRCRTDGRFRTTPEPAHDGSTGGVKRRTYQERTAHPYGARVPQRKTQEVEETLRELRTLVAIYPTTGRNEKRKTRKN